MKAHRRSPRKPGRRKSKLKFPFRQLSLFLRPFGPLESVRLNPTLIIGFLAGLAFLEDRMSGCEATINPKSPRAKAFQEIFGGTTVPVLSPVAVRGQGPDGQREFYRMDVGKLTTEQRRRLVAHISAKWNISPAAVEASIDDPDHGVPILATDVIVRIDLRMVL